MSENDQNLRVGTDALYGYGHGVQFPAAQPRPHVPGQPAVRTPEGQVVAATVTYGQGALARAATGSPGELLVQRLRDDAVLPALGTAVAAGYDVATPEALTLQPGERTRIPLGFALAIPDHLHGRIESRSGLAYKGLVVLTGVIDADYRGEVMVIMQNFGTEPHEFAAGDRVAQIVFRPTVHPVLRTVDQLDTTARGAGGFGSSGR